MYSFSSILSDTKNFVSNNIVSICIYLILYTIVIKGVFLFFSPDMSSIKDIELIFQQMEQQYGNISQSSIKQMANNLNPQELALIQTFAFNSFINLLLQLVAIILSTSVIISIIHNLAHNSLSINNFISYMTKVIMPLLSFILLGIVIGFVIFILIILIMPLGLMLGVVATIGYQIVFIIFSAIIIESNQKYNLKRKIAISFQVLKREIKNITPMIAIYFALSFFLSYLLGSFDVDNFIFSVIINLISLLINIFVICYFYRLYLLSDNKQAYDTRN